MEDTISNLAKLAQKPGVRATLVLSRETGAIVQSSGLEAAEDTDGNATDRNENGDNERTARLASTEEVAKLVLDHVKSSSEMARLLNSTEEDELKLLRMRTRRNEVVIVPGELRFIVLHTKCTAF